MPFQSEKQRKYLWANEPEIAREWTDKYGSRVKKVNGGRIPFANGSFFDFFNNPYTKDIASAHGKAMYEGPNAIVNTTPGGLDYFIRSNADVSQRISDALKQSGNPIASGVYDIFSPVAAGIATIPYDAKQAYDRMEPGSGITGFGKAWWDEQPFSAILGRTIGAAQPLANRFGGIWDAIKKEFSGSAEAAEVPINKITQDQDEDDPYALTERLMRRGDFRPSSSYPSYNSWQMRAAQASGWRKNAGRIMDFLRGPGTRLTPAQQQANQTFLRGVQRDPQTGRMLTGPFAGQNAPGTSYFGSRTPQEMAQKWALKNQHRVYKTPEMQQKQQDIIAKATGGRDPSQGNTVTGHGKSGMGRSADRFAAEGGLMTLWQR